MTSSIPDSLSTSDLMAFMETAKENVPPTDTMEDATQEELVDFAVENTFAAVQKIGTDFGYKLIADYCIYQLFCLHKAGYEQFSEAGELDRAQSWALDAGQLQAIGKILRTVNVGPQDFQTPMDTDCV